MEAPLSPLESYRQEMDAAFLYEAMAQCETDVSRRRLFVELARDSVDQSKIWQQKIGAAVEYQPSVRARILRALVRALGARAILPALAAMKVRGLSVFHGFSVSHSDAGEKFRHRGIGAGGHLRAAVFGMNDGLVSNASLVLGMAGAASDSSVLISAGVAGLAAGAFSMAAGEYVSVKSMRELYDHQMALEKAELEEFPEEEAGELSMIYQARGMPKVEADRLAQHMIADPKRGLEALSREELGINPDGMGSPIGAAVSSFLAFAVGASLPLVPFVFGFGGLRASIVLTGFGLFGFGMATSLFSGRNAFLSGFRMLVIGAIAGAVTYTIGRSLGFSG